MLLTNGNALAGPGDIVRESITATRHRLHDRHGGQQVVDRQLQMDMIPSAVCLATYDGGPGRLHAHAARRADQARGRHVAHDAAGFYDIIEVENSTLTSVHMREERLWSLL